jgi:hypothetical protein
MAIAKRGSNQSLVYLSRALCRVAKDSLTHKRYLPLEKDFANKLRCAGDMTAVPETTDYAARA